MDETPQTLQIAVVVAAIAALGNLVMAIAHTGVTIPLLSRLGPQGGAVPVAVGIFAAGTLAFGLVAFGLQRRSRVAWIAGIVIAALSILSGISMFRGPVTAIAMVLAAVLLALLLAPRSRQAVG
ncbi:hypothetical protein BH23ACT9_BH23ACT9_35550 [soil metagenome]